MDGGGRTCMWARIVILNMLQTQLENARTTYHRAPSFWKIPGNGMIFRFQVSEMGEMISLKMGVNFATSHNMGDKLLQESYLITL